MIKKGIYYKYFGKKCYTIVPRQQNLPCITSAHGTSHFSAAITLYKYRRQSDKFFLTTKQTGAKHMRAGGRAACSNRERNNHNKAKARFQEDGFCITSG